MTRRLEEEIDALKQQMNDIQLTLQTVLTENNSRAGSSSSTADPHVPVQEVLQRSHGTEFEYAPESTSSIDFDDEGTLYYSGQYRNETRSYRWHPQERSVDRLLQIDGDKTAKILAALGHKQRIDILKSVMEEPLTGGELVERLSMGTTGQLYHHIKALTGADLLIQEERGGKYSLPDRRALPLLLLLAAAADLLDTSDYIDMTEARSNIGAYLGGTGGHDPHQLLWSLMENCILEHRAGFCTQLSLFLHRDGSATVSDNGRGIPVSALSQTDKPRVQEVLTDLQRQDLSAPYYVHGGEKGISVAVINALSYQLSVEVRRDGFIHRQDYKHGIPQGPLLTVGVTKETGTSLTFEPDRELFASCRFERSIVDMRIKELADAYPGLQISVHAE